MLIAVSITDVSPVAKDSGGAGDVSVFLLP